MRLTQSAVLMLALPLLLLSGCRSHSQTPAAPPPAVHSSFSGSQAFSMLEAQCDLGVRPPGSAAHEKCKTYILQQLTPYADKVSTQTFNYHDSDRHVTLHLTNIIGVINPTAKKKICLFTHWDTRPTADQDLDHKDQPIIGADDGASGTAALLEMARVFHAKRPDVGVVLLFVDGEDWGPGENRMYLGSIFFAQNPSIYKPDYAILLDMIGQKNLVVKREIYSQQVHPELDDKVWSAAQALGYTQEFPTDPNALQGPIGDDHQPFNNAGIPAIDLIDFDYPYWHTLQDTPDKCSPDSLKVIGDVLAKVIYDEKP